MGLGYHVHHARFFARRVLAECTEQHFFKPLDLFRVRKHRPILLRVPGQIRKGVMYPVKRLHQAVLLKAPFRQQRCGSRRHSYRIQQTSDGPVYYDEPNV
ncbi:hypothetical protein D3C74_362660 [compost metagenome]